MLELRRRGELVRELGLVGRAVDVAGAVIAGLGLLANHDDTRDRAMGSQGQRSAIAATPR